MKKPNLDMAAATLAGVELFADLTEAQRKRVAGLCRVQDYQDGETVISHQDLARDVFFIINGVVRVTIYSSTGREVTFRDMHAGQMFGELSAIDGKPRSAHAIARGSTTVASVSEANFWRILEEFPEVNRRTLAYLSRLVRSLSERVIEFSTLGVKNRIHAELLRLSREAASNGINEIAPAPTHADIANRVSTSREAVTRELSALTKLGIIDRQGPSLQIKDADRLEKLVHDFPDRGN